MPQTTRFSFFFCLAITLTAASSKALAAGPTLELTPGSCEKINDAINSLPKTGGTVRLKAGDFVCQKPVIIERDHVTLIGDGVSKTRLRAADGVALPVVIIGSAINSERIGGIPYPAHVTRDISLSRLSIDGNRHSIPDQQNHECWDPTSASSRNCGDDPGHFIRNNGLTIRRAEHVRVSNVETKKALSGGIVLEKLNRDIVMAGFSSSDNFFDGFAGYETTASVFKNFRLFGNKFSGISVDCFFKGNVFEQGSIYDNGDNGVFSSTVGENTYRRLKIFRNGNLGFYIDAARGPAPELKPVPESCNGNVIENSQIIGKKSGIHINAPCKNTKITATRIHQSDLNCLLLNSEAEVAIKDATCTNGDTTVLLDAKSQRPHGPSKLN